MPLAAIMFLFQLSIFPQNAVSLHANTFGTTGQAASSAANVDAAEQAPSYAEQPVTLAPLAAPSVRFAAAPKSFAPGKPVLPSPPISTADEAKEQSTHKYSWFALSVLQSGAASFDAATTRSVIASGRGVEDNPMLRPFAGNDSLYAAIQVGPVLIDYVGHWMMTRHNRWIRRAWWIPQATGTAVSVLSGVHNLNVAR